MTVLTITADYDGHARYDGTKEDTVDLLRVGLIPKGATGQTNRSFIRFSLADLPANVSITQVRLYVYCKTAGSSTHLTDIHAYGTSGQEDPQLDDGATAYERCASGNLYVDDSDALRSTGDKWFVLGGSVAQDIINAKNAVNRFSLGLHEEGEDDSYADLSSLEDTTYPYPAKLEITYEIAVVVRRIIGDGLTCVVVLLAVPPSPWEGWMEELF